MFCTNCGQKMEDGVVRCPNCGTDDGNNVSSADNSGSINRLDASPLEAAMPNKKAANPAGGKKKINLDKRVIAGGAAALILIIILIVTFILQPKKYNLEDYVELNVHGYDGYGTAQASIDESTLLRDIFSDKGKKTELEDFDSFTEFGEVFQDSMILEKAFDTIDLEFKPDSANLSNGDKIKVTIDYDNDVAKESKIKFTGKSVELTVEGLDPIEEVNPFDDLEVSYSGVSPNGSFDFNYNGDTTYVSSYSFSVDKFDGLANGDIVTVSVDADDDYTVNRGYVITEKERQFTVSGLDEYVLSYADLPEDSVAMFKKEAEDKVYSYTASDYSSSSSLTDLTYFGYVLTSDKGTNGSVKTFNSLYVIYSGKVSSSAGSFSTSTVYYPVKFTNISTGESGVTYGDIIVVGESYIDGTYSSTRGYTNPYTCYMEIVDAVRETHSAEVGDGFENYAEYENISQLSDISTEYRDILLTDAKDRVESYIASNYNSSSVSGEVTLSGEYLLISKDQGTNFSSNNQYIIVLSALIVNSYDNFDPTTVYYPVGYNGIVKLPDNNFMVSINKSIYGKSYFPKSFSSTKGYIDGQEMFSKLVTANRDSYTYEVSEGLKALGE